MAVVGRMMYIPTEKQTREWAEMDARHAEVTMPTDEQFKAMWKKHSHGKTTGWGLMKRDWIISNLQSTSDYQRGLWQGRVDAARGLEYGEERSDSAYNLGYYRGYTEFASNWRGWDAGTQERFRSTYMADLEG